MIAIRCAPVRLQVFRPILFSHVSDLPQQFRLDETAGDVGTLAAVEGAILLVDATQGIQAQTLANLQLAKKEKLKIIGVVNKIDLVNDPEKLDDLKIEISKLIDQKPEEILAVSAKTGANAEKILEKVVTDFPAPEINPELTGEKSFRALVFDSHFDAYKGVLAYIRVIEGEITKQKMVNALASGAKFQVLETGIFKPELVVAEKLSAGEIGYIATGLKNPELIRVGDTICGQRKLKNSRVLVVGAGGLGCPALQFLAAAGVGTIGICDGDRLDASNLHRQVLYNYADIGEPKAQLAARRVAELNPFINATAYPERLNDGNATALFGKHDLASDCTDNFYEVSPK